jgi:hypothetical protein
MTARHPPILAKHAGVSASLRSTVVKLVSTVLRQGSVPVSRRSILWREAAEPTWRRSTVD